MMRVGQKQEAVTLLKQAIQLRSDLQVAHLDLAILYTEDKQNDAAIAEFRRAIQIDPSGYEAHYRLARLYRELGRTAEAQAEFAIVQKLHEKRTEEPLMKISGSSR